MTFIIMLIALVIERFFDWSHLRNWGWFNRYQQWLSAHMGNKSSYFLLAICVLPLTVLIAVINHFLSGWLYGTWQIIFGAAVLVYSMGPANLWAQTFTCLSDLNKEDPISAVECVQSAFGVTATANSQAFHRGFANAIFTEANQRIFAVVFWFAILGPAGAILYRLVALCVKPADLGLTQLASKSQQILDWLPVRLFTLIFALGGHFVEVFRVWKKDAKTGINGNSTLLTDCGVAALHIENNNQLPEDGSVEKSALELLDRVFIFNLVILALLVLAVR